MTVRTAQRRQKQGTLSEDESDRCGPSISKAQTHLARLVEQAARGDAFIIAKAGKPLVKVVPINEPDSGPVKRIGFLEGQINVPDDFNQMGQAEIERLFGSS